VVTVLTLLPLGTWTGCCMKTPRFIQVNSSALRAMQTDGEVVVLLEVDFDRDSHFAPHASMKSVK
jgi:hypothetical protein